MIPGAPASRPNDPEYEELRARLGEAEDTLAAIRNGDVDAVVVGGPSGQQVYTLENADRPYRVLIEQMQEGAVTLSRDGSILYCNERFAVMTASKREHLIGAEFAELLHGDSLENFHYLLATAAEPQAGAELVLRTCFGQTLPVNISLIDLIAEEGALHVVCAVVTDLSLVRKRADELAVANSKLALEIDERRRVQGSLQLALDAAGMGSWDLDLRTNLAQRSLRHDNLFGYASPQTQWGLDTAIEHFIEEDRQIVTDAFAASERSGSLEFEARIRRASDGSTRWLRVTGQTFYEDAQAVRIAGVVADVTDRRAVEERLRQAQKIEAIGQLTGGVAHDFNNLLMVISGGLDMMDRQTDRARRDRIRAGMRHAVERGSGLSRQLLAFSRRQALRPEPVDLVRQIGGMQELLDRSLRGDMHVATEMAKGLWPIEVDPGELELVILNLAVNARDAMPSGGLITIRAANSPDLSDGELQGDYVRLSVIDTGTGMPPEVVARVFEPFFTTKEVGKGSGLGLAQTLGFVQASGGAVRIDSVMGVGTEICLLLPRTNKLPSPDEKHSVRPLATQKPAASYGEVLLVEDDDEVAALTIEMIEHLGFRAVRAASAEAALGALANGRMIDLVFSDVMMPGAMNGVDLAREIRQRRPDLPVLLTSGYAEAARHQAEADGIYILPKPYRIDALADAFEAVRPLSESRGPLKGV